MPFDPFDNTTWRRATLFTPEGPVKYWVQSDLEAYYEQHARDNSLTRVQLAVSWQDSLRFKKYALGFCKKEKISVGPFSWSTLYRYTPLRLPITDTDQYLIDLKKAKLLPGHDNRFTVSGGPYVGRPLFPEPVASLDNWWTLPSPGPGTYEGVPPQIVYDATFQNVPYDVLTQDQMAATADGSEQRRFVLPSEKGNPRERKVPSFGYERDDTGTPIDEVGFVPYYDETHVLTWLEVPWELVPRTAIGENYLKINNAPFGLKNDGTYGRWRTGTTRFDGLARELFPYKSAAGFKVVDVPYLFTHQPGDGTDDTMWKVPVGTTWVKIRRRGSSGADADRLYLKGDLEKLFRPE